MNQRTVLLGPCPPPYGGVSIFTSALFEVVSDCGVELWAAGADNQTRPNVHPLKYRKLGLLPLLLRRGSRARIVDSYYFLIEYPNPIIVPIFVILKLILRFKWIKVIHDGSLPSRYRRFSAARKLLFHLSVRSADEFVVVNDNINQFLRNEVGVRRDVRTVNALLPMSESDRNVSLSPEILQALVKYDVRVVSTGVFISDYGFAHAAEAVENIRVETGRNIGLILVDGAFAPDDEYRQTVLHGREWITVLEQAPHPQVLEIFRRSDGFVRGFRNEGYGLSRIEAIWCGIPVIAAMGEESRGMLLYQFGDIKALTDHLRVALLNESKHEIQKWADVFQRQAEDNLERWKGVLQVTCREKS